MASKHVLNISGAYGEGGGQIIRNAATLAVLLQRFVDVTEIRANRPNPGLAAQHLHSITALTKLSGATTTNLAKQSTHFTLDASGCSAGNQEGITTTVDLVTAGSTTLAMQCILPYLMTLKSPSEVKIIGGTHVIKSPSFDYFKDVFIPTLNLINGREVVKTELGRPGFFPRGGGSIKVQVNPSVGTNPFPHFTLNEFKASGGETTILHLPQNQSRLPGGVNPSNTEVRRTQQFTAIEVINHSSPPHGHSFVFEGRKPPNISEVENELIKLKEQVRKFEGQAVPIDHYMQDQMIIYMALAKLRDPAGTSCVRTVGPLSDHTLSAIYTAELFGLPNKFSVTQVNEDVWDISI